MKANKIKVFILSMLAFSCIGCASNKSGEEITIGDNIQEYFNVDVTCEKREVSYRPEGYAYIWVVDVSPKTMDYSFTAYSEMKVTVYYSCTRRDTGEFRGHESTFIDVEFDKQGFGYKEKIADGAGNLQDIIMLDFECEVSTFEKAIRR